MVSESQGDSHKGSQSPIRTQSPDRGRSGLSSISPAYGRFFYKKPRVLEVPIEVLVSSLSSRVQYSHYSHFQVWRKYGFVLLWAAVGLDLIFSVIGYPFLGQAISAIFVIIYLFDHVGNRPIVLFIEKRTLSFMHDEWHRLA